jgi:acyl-CoA synthetase (AMP-forming)/AMP-acid ligase II
MNTTIVNIAQYLRDRAKSNPQTLAVIDPQSNITKTFKQLEERSNGVAQKFCQLNIQKGKRTLIMLKPGVELIVIIFALFKVGAIPIIIDPGMGIINFLKCVRISRPEAVIGSPLAYFMSRVLVWCFCKTKQRVIVRKNKFLNAITPQENFELATVEPDSLAAILFTSGSTGTPKGVCYTHRVFAAQLSSIQSNYGIQPKEVDLPMLPVFALFNPALGITTVIPEMNPSRPATVNPKKIVDAILKFQVSNSFGSPVLWKKIADYCEENDINLPSLRRILMAGCSVPIDLIKRYKRIIPNGVVHTPYGATEALPISSISSEELFTNRLDSKIGQGTCLGRALSNCEIRIIKITEELLLRYHSGLEVGQGEVGEIIVRGPVVTEEYLNLPYDTFKAKIYDGQTVWHRMGDLGFIDSQGYIWFCGRKCERVETFYGTLFTDCCESIINQHRSVYRSALIGIKKGNKIDPAIIIEPNKDTWPKSKKERELLLSEVRALAKQYYITAKIEDFFLYKDFPVDPRHNAKIHRLKLAKHFSK